jgi:hypothetical protein
MYSATTADRIGLGCGVSRLAAPGRADSVKVFES